MADPMIDTYLAVVPAFRGYVESEESGRVWEIRILEPTAPTGPWGQHVHPDGDDTPITLGNVLRLRWGREEDGFGPTLMASTCEFEVRDRVGDFVAFLRRQHDAERVRVIALEVRTPAMVAPAEPLVWTGTLYAPSTGRPYYRAVRAGRVELTAYCGLGRSDREKPLFVDEDAEGGPEPEPVVLSDFFQAALWKRGRLDVEYVFDARPAAPAASGVQNLRFGLGLEGASLREQLLTAARTFGLRVFQTFRAAWRVQHRPTIGASVADARAQRVRGGVGSFPTYDAPAIPERRIAIGQRAGGDATESDVRRLAGVRVIRQGQANYVRDGGFAAWGPSGLTHYTQYGPSEADNGVRLPFRGPGVPRSGIEQRVMRVEPQAGAYPGFRYGFTSRSGRAYVRVLLEGEDGRLYLYRGHAGEGWVAWNGDRGVALHEGGQISDSYSSDGVYMIEPSDARPTLENVLLPIPGHSPPVAGHIVLQLWGDSALGPTPQRDIVYDDLTFRIVDAAGNDVSEFEVLVGGDDTELVALEPAPGVEAWNGSSLAWMEPTGWTSRLRDQSYHDLPEYQAYDRLGQQVRDLLLWRGELRGIVEPDARLLAAADGTPVELIPVSIEIEAAPRERSAVVAVELIL